MRLVDQHVAAQKRREEHVGPVVGRVPEADWPDGMRWCGKCQSFIPLFYASGSRCKACAWHASRMSKVKGAYGITQAEYDRVLALQGGLCAICRKRSTDRTLAVDHNHQTGVVRGLLCKPCNHDLLGAARESAWLLRRAADYLDNPPTSGEWTP
jgi:hypothetical protein